jgi:serine/threonine-protein kinase
MDDFLLARVIDGRYLIRRRLGRGSAGSVFEGEHLQTKRRVAIKVLHYVLSASGELRSRFEREAQAASRLSHPACVSVLDFGRIAKIEPAGGADDLLGIPYLVMEFVSGELLLDRIHKGPLAAGEALLILRGVLSGLRHAHGLGIVHRDVKPENIMLSSVGDPTPLVKLLDFGLAHDLSSDAAGASAHLEQGKVFGSPRYLSPEQAVGQPADARSDLYALGVVLFEMVCGRPPFVRTELVDLLHDHASAPPPSPRQFTPSLSSELEAVILKLLAKPPEQRYQTADELQAALASCPEWAASGAADPAWSSRIVLVDPEELLPASVPASVPTNVPTYAPASVPTYVPASVPTYAPASVPANVPTYAPASVPANVVASVPMSVAAEVPTNVPEPVPAASNFSTPNLRPARWRNVAFVVVVLLLVAAGVIVRATRHNEVAMPTVAVASNPERAPESRLSPTGRRHLSVAQDYARKFWCSAAIDELETGVHEAPELRTDPELTRTMLPCLRAKTQDKTVEFLVTVVGRGAKPGLESALSEDLKPDVRDGVQRVLQRLASRR